MAEVITPDPTEEQKKRYLEIGGVRCLFCNSRDIEAQPFQAEAGDVWTKVTCNACGKKWTDVYRLVDVEVYD